MNDIEFLRAVGIEAHHFPDVSLHIRGSAPRTPLEDRRRDRFIRAYAIVQLVAMVATLIWTLRN